MKWTAFALAFFTVTGAWAQIKKPVSLSYTQMTKCFSELEDEAQKFRVDLKKVKDRLDEKFPTTRTERVRRVMKFRDAAGVIKRLRLDTENEKPPKTTALLESLDSKGSATPVQPLPINRINPTQAEINRLLSGNDLLSDEITDLDTKLNGIRVRGRKDFSRWLELRVEDPANKKILSCEDNKEVGTICTCALR